MQKSKFSLLVMCKLAVFMALLVSLSANAQMSDANVYNMAAESGDDAYDPFADYSEFEEASEEEADVNFFRNGRFFTLGFQFDYRKFTGLLNDIYEGGGAFGGFLSYFFDLRFALQVSYTTGDHTTSLKTSSGTINGKITVSETGFHLKYFLNTQNVTKGLASLNPYVIGGFSQMYRTAQLAGVSGYSRDGAMSFDGGVGVEIPMMRHKMYLGAQLIYHYVNFSDENTEIVLTDASNNPIRTGIYPKGDLFMASAILGINF